MEDIKNTVLSRRLFLQKTAMAGAGLTLAFSLTACRDDDAPPVINKSADTEMQDSIVEANAYVKLGLDNTVTIVIKNIEFGQGTYTGLATLAAEEMDADWSQVVCESSPPDTKRYGRQSTGGSRAIATSYMTMREAGAAVRHLLVGAASDLWQVPTGEITVSKGIVSHKGSSRKASFGELAKAAVSQKIPETVVLKDPKDFTLIGQFIPRKDIGKTDGTAIYTQDIQLPDMLTAVVAHAPLFGARFKQFDASEALKVKGVVDVKAVPSGVAVIAETFWQAKKGRDALSIQWDDSAAFKKSSEELMAEYRGFADKTGLPAKVVGNVEQGFEQADKIIEAEYEFPYLSHATMEPMNCVVHIQEQSAELWYGCQSLTQDHKVISEFLGLEQDKVNINTLYAGGSFGRRAAGDADYVMEALHIAKAYGKTVPIKLVWTREDDQQAGHYRPMYFHKLKAGIDKSGNITAWRHHIVGQSILLASPFASFVKDGIDITSVEGATNPPYKINNMSVELTNTANDISVLWWRSVGSTHTAYATETFMDELAAAANKDPVEYRRALLIDDKRYTGVIDLAAEKGEWGTKTVDNRVKGFAVHRSFGTYVAQVVELSIAEDKTYNVEKVVCAVDCGVAVNPDIIKAQMEGGIGYGLSPTIMSQITLEDGKVVEANFDKYQVVRMNTMPDIDVHIVASAEPPTGVGEPSTPVVAPAVANALFAATSRPRHVLPLGNKV